MAHYSSHTVCLCFLTTRHSYHGSAKKGSEHCRWHDVSQDSHTWGTSPPDLSATCWCIARGFLYCWVTVIIDTQYLVKGAAFNSQCLVTLHNASVLITVFGQKRESSISEAKPKGRSEQNSLGHQVVSRRDRGKKTVISDTVWMYQGSCEVFLITFWVFFLFLFLRFLLRSLSNCQGN